jgi:hypothetical protein
MAVAFQSVTTVSAAGVTEALPPPPPPLPLQLKKKMDSRTEIAAIDEENRLNVMLCPFRGKETLH